MKRFDYFEPPTLDHAIELMQQANGRASFMAGGTDLLVEIKEHIRLPDTVINIKKIPNLDYLTYDDVTGLKFGALTTMRAIEISMLVQEKYAGLAQAAREVGSIQIRNRATVAGNICRASPSADTLPSLIADGAAVKLYGPNGERTILMEAFFTGPGKTVMAEDEVLIEIAVPPPPPHTGKVYIKHGRRLAMELATVGVAVALTLEDNICKQVRLVLGAVAPTPIRVPKAEAFLQGKIVTDEAILAAAKLAQETARPISDVRSSAAYRSEMVYVLTQRALKNAVERAS